MMINRRISVLLAIFLLILPPVANAQREPSAPPTRVETIRQHLLHPGDGTVLVVAHRGDWRTAPENSLEAVEAAIRMGADIVELDVRRTLDGVLVLMHNPSIGATTNGRGLVSLSTYRRLSRKSLLSGCRLTTASRIPTLEEVLLLAKDRVMLNLDKAFGYFDEIVALAEKTGTLDQIIFKSRQSPGKIEKALGSYKDKVLIMPIVYLSQKHFEKDIEEYLERLHAPMFEVIYPEDKDSRLSWMKDRLRGRSRIWINTLWDSMCGGHSDERSFYDGPDAGYGYLIDTMEAGAIQTDRPALLIDYLNERSRRVTPTPQTRCLWMQSLPMSTD